MHADLSQLLDAVCRRARLVEVSTALDHSIRAAITTDRIGDAEAVHVRYAEHPSEALQAALVDAATWINQHPHHGERICTDWASPQVELACALTALLNSVTSGEIAKDPTAAIEKARGALAKWSVS
jgi:hypothetical protein